MYWFNPGRSVLTSLKDCWWDWKNQIKQKKQLIRFVTVFHFACEYIFITSCVNDFRIIPEFKILRLTFCVWKVSLKILNLDKNCHRSIYHANRPPDKSAYQKIISRKLIFLFFSQPKHMLRNSNEPSRIETVLLSTQNICLNWWVRK